METCFNPSAYRPRKKSWGRVDDYFPHHCRRRWQPRKRIVCIAHICRIGAWILLKRRGNLSFLVNEMDTLETLPGAFGSRCFWNFKNETNGQIMHRKAERENICKRKGECFTHRHVYGFTSRQISLDLMQRHVLANGLPTALSQIAGLSLVREEGSLDRVDLDAVGIFQSEETRRFEQNGDVGA